MERFWPCCGEPNSGIGILGECYKTEVGALRVAIYGEKAYGVKRKPDSSQRGLTLTELLIVVGIMGMVIIMTQGWLASQLPKWRLNGAVRQIVSDLQAAKMKAVVEHNRQRIFFPDDRHYVILDDDNNNGRMDAGEKQEVRDIQADFRDVTVSTSNNPSFWPRGTATNLASITLLNAAGSRKVTISITGRVKVKS